MVFEWFYKGKQQGKQHGNIFFWSWHVCFWVVNKREHLKCLAPESRAGRLKRVCFHEVSLENTAHSNKDPLNNLSRPWTADILPQSRQALKQYESPIADICQPNLVIIPFAGLLRGGLGLEMPRCTRESLHQWTSWDGRNPAKN